MRLASDLRDSLYLSALNGSLSERKDGEHTEEYQTSYVGEAPFQIPETWKWCYFSDVVDIATNLVDPLDYQDYFQIAPDYIEKGTGVLKPCNTVFANKIISKNHLFHKGQVIYSKIRPALRKAVIAPFDGLCSADMYPLNSSLNTRFLLFLILSDYFTKKAVEKSAREKMPKINQKDLSQIPIPVPPIEEQQRIVDRVNELMPMIDDYEATENQLVALKERFPRDLRDAILQAAMQGRLTEQLASDGTAEELLEKIKKEKEQLIKEGKIKKEKALPEISEDEIPFDIPENWKWVRHNALYEISGGSQPPKSFFSDQPKPGYVRLFQIRDYGDTPVPVYVPKEKVSKFSKKGDVLLARYGGSLGKVFRAEEGAYNVAIAKVIPKFSEVHYNPDFAEWYYRSELFQDFVRTQANTRSAQPGFNQDDMARLLIPLPPLAEQHRIVARLNELLPLCDTLEEAK